LVVGLIPTECVLQVQVQYAKGDYV
jgi:hypothetical protein